MSTMNPTEALARVPKKIICRLIMQSSAIEGAKPTFTIGIDGDDKICEKLMSRYERYKKENKPLLKFLADHGFTKVDMNYYEMTLPVEYGRDTDSESDGQTTK